VKKLGQHLGIVWAIARKDIGDALRNKSVRGQLITVVFLAVIYKFLPVLGNQDMLPRLAVHAENHAELLARLDKDPDFDLVQLPTRERLEWYVGYEDFPVLGMDLSDDLDLGPGSQDTELRGFYVYWLNDRQVAETTAFFEAQLSEALDVPVRIVTGDKVVYTQPEGGLPFYASVMLVVAIMMVGALGVPHLVIEEKETQTLEALMVSPASAWQIVAGKAIAGLAYVLLASAGVLAVNWKLLLHPGLTALAVLWGALFAVGIGLLLGTTLRVKAQLTLWGFMLMQPLLLPPFLEPLDLLPQSVRTAMGWIPSTALAKVLRVSFSGRASWDLYGVPLAITAGGAVLVLAAVVLLVGRTSREAA
jgi:ABC-type transport system involved in multi-copper enzyme maturation permease subunit